MSGAYEMSNRTTSAGYRLPLQSRPRSSQFHQNCIPAAKRDQAAAVAATTTSSNSKEGDHSKCDAVIQDEIWKQAVDTEKHGVKQW